MIVRSLLKAKPDKQVVTIDPAQSIDEAAECLHRRRIGALVVTEDGRRIAGILSERDIARGVAEHREGVHQMRVADLMTRAVILCSPHDTLERVMDIMTNRRIRHLPVVENDQLLGIISIGDVVKSRLEETVMQVDQLRDYVASAR